MILIAFGIGLDRALIVPVQKKHKEFLYQYTHTFKLNALYKILQYYAKLHPVLLWPFIWLILCSWHTIYLLTK